MIPVSRPSLGPEEMAAVGEVFKTGWLGMGEKTLAFEEAVKHYLGCENVVAVNTGTSAIHLALDAFGIRSGDEVILPSLTFVASVQAVLAVGATPVFCESQEKDLLMDLDDVQKKITRRTRVVMPVHYRGKPCEMDSLLPLAQEHNFWVIEDAAHAFGSTYGGRKIGSFGHAACFSFDPIKNITCGEGGAVALPDRSRAEEIRQKRNLGLTNGISGEGGHPGSSSHLVTTCGWRYHMPNFCAAIGLVQMKKLDGFIRRRRDICTRYDRAFRDLGGVRTLEADYEEVAPHLYVLRILEGERDGFMNLLKERGISTGIHYRPNHLQPFFRKYVKDPLPRTTQLGEEIVSLPLYPKMKESEVDAVIDAVLAFESSVTIDRSG